MEISTALQPPLLLQYSFMDTTCATLKRMAFFDLNVRQAAHIFHFCEIFVIQPSLSKNDFDASVLKVLRNTQHTLCTQHMALQMAAKMLPFLVLKLLYSFPVLFYFLATLETTVNYV